MLTVEELIEAIKREYDIELLCEALEVTADELLSRFDDKLMIHLDKFKHLEQDYESHD